MLISKKTNASLLLDLMRGAAAFLVAIGHWRNLFFADFPQITAHQLYYAPFYLLTSVGHQAVIVFFVLSGYLVGGNVLAQLRRDKWDWAVYLTHRLTRLWVVLVPGLLLGLLWDTIRLRFAPGRPFYQAWPASETTMAAHALGVKVFLANLFFLQGIRAPVYGSNGPLWSLANEFWYYMLFPFGLLVFYRHAGWRTRIISGVLCIAIGYFVRGQILAQFPIWLAGAVLAVLPRLRLGKSIYALATALYLPQPFLFSKYRPLSLTPNECDYIFTCSTFLFVWMLLSVDGEEASSALNRFIRELARFSFTLYVVHMPALALLAAIAAGQDYWFPSFAHLAEGLAALGLVLGYAYGVAELTEFRTDTFRRFLEERLLRKSGSGMSWNWRMKKLPSPSGT